MMVLTTKFDASEDAVNITEHISVSKTSMWVRTFKQHLAALLANLSSVTVGVAISWSAPAMPILLGQVADPQPLRLSLEQASWAVSAYPLASLAGALVAGPLADRVGRKGALLLGAAPTLLGYLCVMFAGSLLSLLILGRILIGLAAGAVIAPVSLYCEEIAEVHVRGALGCYHSLMNCFGQLFITIMGALLPYFWFTATSLVFPVLLVLTFSWMPESPAFLARRGRRHDAQRALRWWRGPIPDVDRELDMLLVAPAQDATPDDSGPRKSILSVCCRRPWKSTALRSLAVLIPLMILQQMTGVVFIMSYNVQLFEMAGGSISSHLSNIIAASATVVGALLAVFVVDRVGRRILLMITLVILGSFMVFLSVYTIFNVNGWNVEGWTWVPLVSIVFIVITYSLGPSCLPNVLMAEMLPMYAKGWASSTAVVANRGAMFLVVKEVPAMLYNVGQFPTYMMFAVSCFMTVIFTKLFVPETKGKNKEEILRQIEGDFP